MRSAGLAVWLLLLAPSAEAGAAGRCAAPSAATVAAKDRGTAAWVARGVLHACRRPSGRPVRIGRAPGAQAIRVAGVHVAAASARAEGWRVVSGRRDRRGLRSTVVARAPQPYAQFGLRGLHLTRRGTVALVADGRVTLVRDGVAEVLDEAAGGCRSRLWGARLEWCSASGASGSAWIDSRCRIPKGAVAVHRGTHVDTYSDYADPDDVNGISGWVGCRRSDGRVRLLLGLISTFGAGEDVRASASRGHRVATVTARWDRYGGGDEFVAVSLDAITGREIVRAYLGHNRDGGSFAGVHEIAVHASGAMAAFGDLDGTPRVVAITGNGVVRELERGDGIDPGSLRLDGDTVRWRRAGMEHSAALFGKQA